MILINSKTMLILFQSLFPYFIFYIVQLSISNSLVQEHLKLHMFFKTVIKNYIGLDIKLQF